MRQAKVFVNYQYAGVLEELPHSGFRFCYDPEYKGLPISLTMPINKRTYEYSKFPPFFEGLLPEGVQLEILLRKFKIDREDFFSQLIQVGQDLVGAVTIEKIS